MPIMKENTYELFTYPCLRRHELLRLSGAAQWPQRGPNLSGCAAGRAGSRPDIKGCSRTDAGVHALGFKLNFHADTRIPAAKLPLALNQHLPPDIRVLDAQVVPEDFHARYAAHTKPTSTASTTTPSTRLLTRLITPGCPGIWTKPECRRRRSSSWQARFSGPVRGGLFRCSPWRYRAHHHGLSCYPQGGRDRH